jgi:hypothetical protein
MRPFIKSIGMVSFPMDDKYIYIYAEQMDTMAIYVYIYTPNLN